MILTCKKNYSSGLHHKRQGEGHRALSPAFFRGHPSRLSCAFALEKRKARFALWPCVFFAASAWTYAPTGWLRERQGEGAKGRPRMKRQRKRSSKSRRAHLRIAFGNARAPCREPRQSLRFGESLRGAGGSAPSYPFWRRGGLTATKQTASEKSPCAAGAGGLFSLSPAPRSGLFAARDPSRRGRVLAPGAGAFVPPLFPPDGGRRRRRRGGGTFTPSGVSLGSLAQGRRRQTHPGGYPLGEAEYTFFGL